MKKLVLALFLGATSLAPAAVINVEFKFTPFVGDPAIDQEVTTVPGKAQIFIDNVPFSEQETHEEKLPVLFDEHEVSPAVWLPMSSAGAVVRKGKNKVRIEFTPNDPAKAYRAQFRWASVTDQPTEEAGPGSGHATNQADEGVDDRKTVKGKVVFEREFTADFALDLRALVAGGERDRHHVHRLGRVVRLELKVLVIASDAGDAERLLMYSSMP